MSLVTSCLHSCTFGSFQPGRLLFDIQSHTECFRVYGERCLSKGKEFWQWYSSLPDTQLLGPSCPRAGRRQVPAPGLGRAPQPLLSSPIFPLLCALGVTADTWDVTFWHTRLWGSSGAGVGASTWLSQPGTCQTKFHSWLGVKLGLRTDLDQSDLLKSNDNVCLSGAYWTGHAPRQVPGTEASAAKLGGRQVAVLDPPPCLQICRSLCLLTFEQIVLMQMGYFALFWVSYMHEDY